MVIIKYFISSKEITFYDEEPSKKEKIIESGIYESDLEIDDFVEKLKAEVISVSDFARIVRQLAKVLAFMIWEMRGEEFP